VNPVLHTSIQVSPIISYIRNRQDKDGGYTFAQWTESSAEDTYYAIRILEMLKTLPLRVTDTVQFLRELQHSDGSYDSIKVAYYCTTALSAFGSAPRFDVRNYVNSLAGMHGIFGNLNVNIETSSEFETTYFTLRLLKHLDKTGSDNTIKFILGRLNDYGSFGRSGYSKLAALHFALASLKLMNHDIQSLDSTLRWIRYCELPTGGFTTEPRDTSYLVIDELYHGLNALRCFKTDSLYAPAHLQLLSRFQNGNGGFRRSIFLGISNFESTFYAVTCLRLLNNS
jgi:hypothetical protein